jgi:O-methyltransferase
MIKIFIRKYKTLLNRFRQKGFKSALYLLRIKISPGISFGGISSSVSIHLSEKKRQNLVANKLSEGVYHSVEYSVDGDIAEFGTCSGNSAVALATALESTMEAFAWDEGRNKARKLWLFDSFEGLPEARFDVDTLSPHVSNGLWSKGSCKGLTSEKLTSVVLKYLANSELKVIKGWFKDTVPLIPSETKFAMIHIDGDLYESAIDVLDNLFTRNMISEGAMVYFDDWNCNGANPEMGERKAWSEVVEKFSIQFSDMGHYGIGCHRFIVHSYTQS